MVTDERRCLFDIEVDCGVQIDVPIENVSGVCDPESSFVNATRLSHAFACVEDTEELFLLITGHADAVETARDRLLTQIRLLAFEDEADIVDAVNEAPSADRTKRRKRDRRSKRPKRAAVPRVAPVPGRAPAGANAVRM